MEYMKDLHEVEELLNFWNWPANGTWEMYVGNVHLTFNPTTLIMTWITMLLVILFCVAATRKMSMTRPKGRKTF